MVDDKSSSTNLQFHKATAVSCFNATWDYLELAERSKDQEMTMLSLAHTSWYHWSVLIDNEMGSDVNKARSYWLISRVYATLKDFKNALLYGISCLEVCTENEIGDFDLAFGYEAIARAHKIGKNDSEKEKYLALAQEKGELITKKEDREWFYKNLTSL